MKPITFISEQPHDYAKALSTASTRIELLAVLREYLPIANDAFDAAPKDDKEFAEFRKGLLKERKGKFAGEEFSRRYGVVLLPEIMVKVDMIAAACNAPWGCAYLQLKQAGKIVVNDAGIVRWKGN